LTVLVYVHIYQYIYIGDIFCYMLLCIYQCILIYIDVCCCTYTIYIYIYWATLCRSKCTLSLCSCENRSLYIENWEFSVKHYYLKHISSPILADYIAVLEVPSYIATERREKDELVSIYINWGQSVITWTEEKQKQKFVSFISKESTIQLLTIHLKSMLSKV